MALVRKQLKNGRIVYQNEKGKFVKAGAWVKDQFDNIGKAKGSQINYNGLTTKEKRSYNAQKQSREMFRYKGTYQNTLLNPILRATGYDPKKDLRNFLTMDQLTEIKRLTQTLDRQSVQMFDKKRGDFKYHRTKTGNLMDIAKDLADHQKQGYRVSVIDERGNEIKGLAAIELIRDFEMSKSQASGAEKIRFEHRYEINIHNKTIRIDLRKTMIREYGTL